MHEKECVISTNRKTATKRHSQSASRPARSLIFLSNHERRAHQILGFRTDGNITHIKLLFWTLCPQVLWSAYTQSLVNFLFPSPFYNCVEVINGAPPAVSDAP